MWPTDRALLTDKSGRMCEAWHALHWGNIQTGPWARPHNVGGQRSASGAYCGHALWCVCEHPESIEHRIGIESFLRAKSLNLDHVGKELGACGMHLSCQASATLLVEGLFLVALLAEHRHTFAQ